MSSSDLPRQGLRSQAVDEPTHLELLHEQPKDVGLLYDDRMLSHYCAWDAKFPENPNRLRVIMEQCGNYRLIDRCRRLEVTPCSVDDVLLVHDEDYVNKIKSTESFGIEELKELSTHCDAVYLNEATYSCSLLAAGAAIELVNQIMQKKIRSGFALVRPPGHHAMAAVSCGYCLFNNVAIAAKHAIDRLKLDRVLIVDFDVHAGQGSQFTFYDDPRVLFISIHRYEHGNFWPNLRESDYDYIGARKGQGYNVNIPLSKSGNTDGDYLAIFHQVILPLAYEFDPQLVLVSAGFDSALGDFEGDSKLTPALYAHMTHLLMSLAEGRLALILEGGYCLESLSHAAALCLRQLLGDPVPSLSAAPPSDATVETIVQVLRVLRPYWSCLAYQWTAAEESEVPGYCRDVKLPKEGVALVAVNHVKESYALDSYESFVYSPEEFDRLKQEINQVMANTTLLTTSDRTCFVVNDSSGHQHPQSHVECPDRTEAILSGLTDLGLADRCLRVDSRLATCEELQTVHGTHYVEETIRWAEQDLTQLLEVQRIYNSIYIVPGTPEAARQAAGSVLNALECIMTGQARNGLAIVRPPGHHAESNMCKGFCIYNNVAVAAAVAKEKYGLKKILIVDWDVHHGNGTQEAFYQDPSILFISIHRFDKGHFYPSFADGGNDRVGRDEGTGFNINIAWNSRHCGDAEYIAAFHQVVLPVAYEFNPDLVLVSAGFDAAQGDPLGGYQVTPECFGHMTHMLSSVATGRVLLVLEGGYNVSVISDCMSMCASVLLGDQVPALGPMRAPAKSAIKTIREVLDIQMQYWSCLRPFRVQLPSKESTLKWLKSMVVKSDDEVTELANRLEYVKVTQGDILAGGDSIISDNSGLGRDNPGHVSGNTSQAPGNPAQTPTHPGQAPDNPGHAPDNQGHDPGAGEGAVAGGEVMPLYAVAPAPWCPHLTSVQPVPVAGVDVHSSCSECQHVGENWVCLTCYGVHCSRYVQGHMVEHWARAHHPLALSYSDLSVWCYRCEDYLHNEVLLPAKRAAYISKFGEDIPVMQ